VFVEDNMLLLSCWSIQALTLSQWRHTSSIYRKWMSRVHILQF